MKNLAGFPMLMAVRPEAINAQLASIFNNTDDLPKKWSLPEEPTKGDPDYATKLEDYNNTGWNLTVDKFAAPQIDFNAQNAGNQACRLILPIVTGSFTTYSVVMNKGKPEVVPTSVKLDGVKIYATTQVNKIVHTQFTDEEFEVQALYADLEQISLVDFALSQEIDVAVLGTVKSSLQTVIQDKLADMGKQNPTALLFGQVSIPKLTRCKAVVGALAPTACTYTVARRLKDEDGSLVYLLWMDDPSAMPHGSEAGLLNYDWGMYSTQATLVISAAVFLEKFVVPALQQAYPGIKFTLTGGDTNAEVNYLFDERSWGDSNSRKALASDLQRVIAKASLTDNYAFSYDGLDSPVFTKMDVWINGEAIEIDYEFTFQHRVMALFEHYKATGKTSIIVGMKDGKLQTSVDNKQPTVQKLQEDFWTDIAQGLGIGFSLGLGYIGYDADQKKGIDLGKSFTMNFAANVSPLPSLFQLPGRAVFAYNDVQLKMGQLLFGCAYSTDQSRVTCPE